VVEHPFRNYRIHAFDSVMRVSCAACSAHDVRTTLIFTGRVAGRALRLPPQTIDTPARPHDAPGHPTDERPPRLKLAPLSDQLRPIAVVATPKRSNRWMAGWHADPCAPMDDPAEQDYRRMGHFLNDLLARLSPAERDALTTSPSW
jgi:hypothetical protein